MATRLLSGPMPLFPLAPGTPSYGMNLFDQTPVSVGYGVAPGWSGGSQLLKTIQRPDTIGVWTILGWGLTFEASILAMGGGTIAPNTPIFASKLGQLYGGITRDSGLPEGSPGPFSGIPRDASMIDLLWDGQQDPPFPQSLGSTPFVPGAASMRQKASILPAPVEVRTDENLQVGLWLTPTLGQNVRLWIFNASYTIMYDPTT